MTKSRIIIKLSDILLLVGVVLLLFFRNPGLFIYPEPWAEDFIQFISYEYNVGFPQSVSILSAGYIHLLPRMVAWISLKFGMTGAMRAMNLIVLLIKIMTFYLIFKSKEINSPFVKYSLLAYLILMPFCEEIYNNVTNLQWWLIPLMAVILVKRENNIFVLLIDITILILTGLTGTNSVLFVLPCVYLYLSTRTKFCFFKSLTIIICASMQLYFLTKSQRIGGGLMYNGGVYDVLNVFVNRVIYTILFNFHTENVFINTFVFIVYIIILIFNLYYYRKNATVKFVFLFSLIYFIAILYNFMKGPEINSLAFDFNGERYFVFLKICSFVLLVTSLNKILKFIFNNRHYKRALAYLCFILCLILLNNYHVDFPFEYQYYSDVEKFKSANIGEIVEFHYAPGWTSNLIKR